MGARENRREWKEELRLAIEADRDRHWETEWSMSIDQERLNAFQARMNGWVSSQGLFFQLRHGSIPQVSKGADASVVQYSFNLGANPFDLF